jgi:predicted GNAT family acetyltransferase
MTDQPDVAREDQGGPRGRYVIALGNGVEAELTYQRRDDGALVADHTYVPTSHRGQGLAEKLVDRLIADARAGGYRIAPLCSYVVAQFRRHPEWADLHA